MDARLAPYVACIWSLEVTASGSHSAHAVVPDGCIDLLFESGAETLNIVGTMTQAVWVADCGPTRFVGVRFKAGGATPFVRDRADLFTDDIVAAEDVFGFQISQLRQQLLEARSIEQQRRLLERFLIGCLEKNAVAVDSRVAWATLKLSANPGCRVDTLANELGVSRQYLRRLFLLHTGLSTKTFGRVVRLGKLLPALRRGDQLAHASFASGYADQAHMNHDFKRLVGITPAAYQSQR